MLYMFRIILEHGDFIPTKTKYFELTPNQFQKGMIRCHAVIIVNIQLLQIDNILKTDEDDDNINEYEWRELMFMNNAFIFFIFVRYSCIAI